MLGGFLGRPGVWLNPGAAIDRRHACLDEEIMFDTAGTCTMTLPNTTTFSRIGPCCEQDNASLASANIAYIYKANVCHYQVI